MSGYVDVFTGDIVQPVDVSYRAVSLTADVTLAWPTLSENSTDVAARIMDVTPSGGGFIISMPPANQVGVGADALFYNLGASSFDIETNSSGAIATVAPGTVVYMYVVDNATTGGSWRVFTFGTGTSAADASALASQDIVAQSGVLHQAHPDDSFSGGSAFIEDGTRGKLVKNDGGAVTQILPLISTFSAPIDGFFFLFLNAGTGVVDMVPTAPDTINGVTSKQFNPGDSAFIVAAETGKWSTVGFGQAVEFAFATLIKDIGGATTVVLSALEAANKIINFVGATDPGGSTVEFPAVSSVYYLFNNTTTGPALLFKITGGSQFALLEQNIRNIFTTGSTEINIAVDLAGIPAFYSPGAAIFPPLRFAGTGAFGGFFQPADGEIGFSSGGVETFRMTATGPKTVGPNGETTNSKIASTEIGAAVGATITAVGLIPDGALVLGVSTRITADLGVSSGTTGYAVGDGVDPNRWGDIVGTVAGTTSNNSNATNTAVNLFIAANNVVLTAAGGNFDGTGTVRISVHYIDISAPTS